MSLLFFNSGQDGALEDVPSRSTMQAHLRQQYNFHRQQRLRGSKLRTGWTRRPCPICGVTGLSDGHKASQRLCGHLSPAVQSAAATRSAGPSALATFNSLRRAPCFFPPAWRESKEILHYCMYLTHSPKCRDAEAT